MTDKIDYTAAREASLAFAAELREAEFSGFGDITGERDVSTFRAENTGLRGYSRHPAADVRGMARHFSPDSAECLKKSGNGGVTGGKAWQDE